MPTRYFLFLILPFTSLSQNQQQIQALHKQLKFDSILSFSGPLYESLQIAHLRKGKKEALYYLEWELLYDQYGNDSSSLGYTKAIIDFEKQRIGDFFPINTKEIWRDELAGEKLSLALLKGKKGQTLIWRQENDDNFEFHVSPRFFKSVDTNFRMGSYIAVQEGKSWYWYDWYEQNLLADFSSDAPENLVGIGIGMNAYSFKLLGQFSKWKTDIPVDQIIMDPINGDGVFTIRSRSNQLWGMYQILGNDFREVIPMQYDSIRFYPWNSPITAVYREGKVGFYLSYWSYDSLAREIVPCEYDDYKRYQKDDGSLYLAVKKEGHWAWIDWINNKLESELIYPELDSLPYPYYQQEYWPEEE